MKRYIVLIIAIPLSVFAIYTLLENQKKIDKEAVAPIAVDIVPVDSEFVKQTLTQLMCERGIQAVRFDIRDVLRTDDNFGRAPLLAGWYNSQKQSVRCVLADVFLLTALLPKQHHRNSRLSRLS